MKEDDTLKYRLLKVLKTGQEQPIEKHNDFTELHSIHMKKLYREACYTLENQSLEALVLHLNDMSQLSIDIYNQETFNDSKFKRDFSRKILDCIERLSEESI